ncbi:phytoene desaturase family protein [Gordonia polyisoprenivorans]|uniref:phytoene desaturase family protein n=1 Tax=Gordonia polyisoprenivorans TaxID=84595 RepID=UPI001AD7A16B|nr:FAD-dependent oxidoreductase [Gordonia polyisoprenivorans]QTI69002.1 NAD(P)/FAD-dependent oxidoreductase [Gordonia polyisoprenivorans]
MTDSETFDAIVIGAGLGGLSVAALLAQKEGKRVLVLERENGIGGRIHHYRGDEIRTPEDYLGPLRASTGWLVDAQPPLEEMIERGLLSGFSFELGMHDIVNGAHSRMCHILEALGVPVEVVPLKACGFWSGGELHTLQRGSFPWFDDDEYAAMRRILREMLTMPIEEVRSYYRDSLKEFVEARSSEPTVIEFFNILGAFTVGMNSARELSAGEFMLITRMPMAAGLHFADGTLGQMGGDSFMEMAGNLAGIITAGGGEVRTGQTVGSILVEGGRAVGVELPGGQPRTIRADIVVSNVPIPLTLDRLLPSAAVPTDFADHVKGLRSSGAFVPIFGLSRSVIDIPGMLMTHIPIDDPAYPDGIVLGYEAHSLFVEGKAPSGKEIIECWVGVDTEQLAELRASGKIDLAKEAIRTFFSTAHPGFDEALEWALYPAFDMVVSVAPTPEQAWDSMLDPKCPGVEGLFFVGDSVKNYGGFMDGVAYGALLCTSEITGKDYLGEVLPAFQREMTPALEQIAPAH